MGQTVKGITIEFDGDTSKLSAAIRKVKDSAKGLDKELAEINRALKFNPGNAQLIAQKQTVLKQKVEQTTQSLKQLKDMLWESLQKEMPVEDAPTVLFPGDDNEKTLD